MEKVTYHAQFDAIVCNWREVLRRCPLFEGIGEDETAGLLSCLGASVRRFARGGMPLLEGQELHTIGIVLAGVLEVAQEDAAGNRHIIGRMGPAELFGETVACAGEPVSPVTVIAVEPAEILDVDFRRLIRPCGNLCSRHTSLIANLLRILAGKNILLTRKMDFLTRRTIRGRVAAYLMAEMRRAEYLEFDIPFDRNGMAEYLSCDRSALSRELGRLRADGVLDWHRNRFAVLDARMLAAELDR